MLSRCVVAVSCLRQATGGQSEGGWLVVLLLSQLASLEIFSCWGGGVEEEGLYLGGVGSCRLPSIPAGGTAGEPLTSVSLLSVAAMRIEAPGENAPNLKCPPTFHSVQECKCYSCIVVPFLNGHISGQLDLLLTCGIRF